jgi:hypothetical protein
VARDCCLATPVQARIRGLPHPRLQCPGDQDSAAQSSPHPRMVVVPSAPLSGRCWPTSARCAAASGPLPPNPVPVGERPAATWGCATRATGQLVLGPAICFRMFASDLRQHEDQLHSLPPPIGFLPEPACTLQACPHRKAMRVAGQRMGRKLVPSASLHTRPERWDWTCFDVFPDQHKHWLRCFHSQASITAMEQLTQNQFVGGMPVCTVVPSCLRLRQPLPPHFGRPRRIAASRALQRPRRQLRPPGSMMVSPTLPR